MSNKFPVAASLAFGGFAFFVGSLLTLQIVSISGEPPARDVVRDAPAPTLVTRTVTNESAPLTPAARDVVAVTQAIPAPATAPRPAPEPVIATPAPTPAPAARDASALLSAIQASATAPGAGTVSPSATNAPSSTGNLALLQSATQTFQARGATSNLSDAIERNALAEVSAGRDKTEIQELLSSAARNGLIQVPDGLKTADGAVDARSLLFSLVEKAVQESGVERAPAPTTTARAVVESVAPAVTPRARNPVAVNTSYVVQPGDSLAFIALQFYGSTSAYTRIFEANRNVLSSPDRIRIGQRLRIPAG